MKLLFLALSAFLLLISSCQNPQSELALLFESLEKLPSVSIKNGSEFSLANENILISGKQQAISLKTIQLLSGFFTALKIGSESICLDSPDSFTKYPFALKQHFQLEKEALEVNQLQIVSQDKAGITLLYYIRNLENSAKSIHFHFQANTDLKPTALMDSTFGSNASDQVIFDEMTGIFTAKDEGNDWYAVWGTSADLSLTPSNSECAIETLELGASAGFEISLELAANEERVVPVFIAGSDNDEFKAIETVADLRANLYSDWDENFALIDSLTKSAKITIPDQVIQDAYNWSRYKVGLFHFEEGNVNPAPLENPEELHSMLEELSLNFPYQLDKNIFSFDETELRHIQPGWELIQPMTLYLLGIYGDVTNQVTYIRPNLPREWKEASIENFWIDDNRLNIEITSDENQMTVEITQTQKKAGLSIEFPVEFSKVKVLGKEVSTDTKDGYRRILMTGDHVKVEAKKNNPH